MTYTANIILLLIAFCQRSIAQDSITFKGEWLVYDTYAGYVNTYGEDSAKAQVGMTFVLSDSVCSFSERIVNPNYSVRVEKTDEYFPIFRRYPEELGIRTPWITVILVKDPANVGNVIALIYDQDRLIDFRDGWFFICKRSK